MYSFVANLAELESATADFYKAKHHVQFSAVENGSDMTKRASFKPIYSYSI